MPHAIGLEDRVTLVERDVRDQAKTLSAVVVQLNAIEKANNERLVVEARQEERSEARSKQLERIEKDVASIKGLGMKVVVIVGGGLLTAFVTFVVKGGLTL